MGSEGWETRGCLLARRAALSLGPGHRDMDGQSSWAGGAVGRHVFHPRMLGYYLRPCHLHKPPAPRIGGAARGEHRPDLPPPRRRCWRRVRWCSAAARCSFHRRGTAAGLRRCPIALSTGFRRCQLCPREIALPGGRGLPRYAATSLRRLRSGPGEPIGDSCRDRGAGIPCGKPSEAAHSSAATPPAISKPSISASLNRRYRPRRTTGSLPSRARR